MTCVYRKELGVYGRYTLYQMITLGYQTRSAIVAAGSYGVPQVGVSLIARLTCY